jgi:hypothetical protein
VRDEGIEAGHEPEPEYGKRVEQRAADAGAADGEGAIGKAADHDRIDHAHRHPAEFREREWKRDSHHGADIGEVCAPGMHSFSLGVQGFYRTYTPCEQLRRKKPQIIRRIFRRR